MIVWRTRIPDVPIPRANRSLAFSVGSGGRSNSQPNGLPGLTRMVRTSMVPLRFDVPAMQASGGSPGPRRRTARCGVRVSTGLSVENPVGVDAVGGAVVGGEPARRSETPSGGR